MEERSTSSDNLQAVNSLSVKPRAYKISKIITVSQIALL